MKAYETLDCYAEVPEVLAALKNNGHSLAILSNGSPDMLASAVDSAGIADYFDDVFSVDPLRQFKTMPSAYALVTQRYNAEPRGIVFQSSNRWDIAGATAFGFRCNWINRTGQPDEYRDLAPISILKDLRGLL